MTLYSQSHASSAPSTRVLHGTSKGRGEGCVVYMPAHVLVLKTPVSCMPHPAQRMHIHPRMHAYPTLQQLLCHENQKNHLESSKLLSAWRQTKNIQLNHYDALAEPEIQRRACWFHTPDCRAAPARHYRSTLCVCLLYPFVPPNKSSNSMPAHDATTLVHRHHPVIHVGAGPVCVWVLCTRFIGVQQCLCKCILFYLYYSQTKKLRNTETKGSRETDSSLKTSELTLPPQSNPLLSLLRINVCVSLPLPPPVLPPPRPFSSSDHRTFSSCFILLERCQNIETDVKWFDLFCFQHFTPLLQNLSLRVIMHVLSVTIISQHTRTTTHTYTHNTHTHTHTHTRTHTRTRTCTCTHTHSHTHAHTRTRARAHARACTHLMHVRTYYHTHVHACEQFCTLKRTHRQENTAARTRINVTCVHTQTHKQT